MSDADGKTILLVEDEALIAMVERQTLERHGYCVVCASTGEQAVEIAAERHDLDLVLMDINLGDGIDGTEAAASILRSREVPIVFLSSHTEPEVVERTEKITSYGYIVKNSGETVLTTSIKMAFRLFESRKLAADTFDYTINGLCVHRLLYDDSGQPYDCEYLKVNAAYAQQTGFSAKDVIGRTIRDLFPDGEAREVIAMYADVVSTQQSVRRTIRFDPTDAWYELQIFPTRGDEFTVVIENVTERTVAHQRLAAEKERLRVTLQSVGDAVIATDAGGRVTLMNPIAERLTGRSHEAAVGRSLADVFRIVSSLTREPAENPVSRVLAEGVVVGLANHTALLSADGGEYQIADSAAPIRDAAGAIIGVVLVFRDVTEEYGIQEALREREREMERAQALASLGSWRVRLDTGTVTASSEAHRIYGLEETDLSLDRVQTVSLPRYRGMLDAALQGLVRHGEPYDVEFELRRPRDGAIRHVHSVAEYDAANNVVLGMIHDVTERKRAEETLRAERARFSMIAEVSPVGIVTVDTDGQISFANVAAEQILGLKRTEITDRTYDAPEWRHTASDGGSIQHEDLPFAIVRRTLGPAYDVRHGIAWPDGRHVDLSVNAIPIVGSDGSFEGMVATFEDITERNHAERRIHSLLEEKELLLRESHHRVKNNMSTIRSLLALQAQSSDSEIVRAALDDAADRVEAMVRLYDKLYRSERRDAMSIRDFLSSLVPEACAVFASIVEVHAAVEGDDVRVDPGVATALGIVVNELITNSVKHGFEGRSRGSIRVAVSRHAAGFSITYQDDGCGMQDAPSSTGKRGFGQELIELIVESLHGSLRVDGSSGMNVAVELPT